VRCCAYVTIEVDPPRAAWEYDQWIWALHHRGVELYVEQPENWHLYLATPCRHLVSGRCAIHGRHPVLCREYDAQSCERRLPLADMRAWFANAEQLEDWLRRNRPQHWRRLVKYRSSRPVAAAASHSGPPAGSPVTARAVALAAAAPAGRRRAR